MLDDSGSDDTEVQQAREEEARKAAAKRDLYWRRVDLARRMKEEIMRGDHDDLLEAVA